MLGVDVFCTMLTICLSSDVMLISLSLCRINRSIHTASLTAWPTAIYHASVADVGTVLFSYNSTIRLLRWGRIYVPFIWIKDELFHTSSILQIICATSSFPNSSITKYSLLSYHRSQFITPRPSSFHPVNSSYRGPMHVPIPLLALKIMRF